ncbi:hypothetical protein AJ78_08695 [Emergomyces pasteurianus Ep9510]|uniref:SAP domain-containing protein n=1 Tax=Emergomyces pasteurianus Ep9510 TaxID=1447872 RepID=A0A1J9Q2M6_9EURO|nr:hypothetical protein AJ78_08695 [Emergomyces pasteurianus Ep9510]
MPTVKELRIQLRALGLSSTGRKAALEQRLQTAQVKSVTPSDSTLSTPGSHCDAFVAAEIEVGDPAVMIEHAEEALLHSINKDQLQYTMVKGNPTVTNTRAVRYIESHYNRQMLEDRFKAVEARLKASESLLKASQSHLADVENELKSATCRISDLEESVPELKDVRNRFISTFKRDILLNDTETDRAIIRTGNRSVHGGNCKRDAELYKAPSLRRDFDIYIKLYGLHPEIVRSLISYRPTIELLNRHATAVADKNIELSTKFNDLFVNFIQALETSNYEEDYLVNPRSDVTVAYWAFLQSCP